MSVEHLPPYLESSVPRILELPSGVVEPSLAAYSGISTQSECQLDDERTFLLDSMVSDVGSDRVFDRSASGLLIPIWAAEPSAKAECEAEGLADSFPCQSDITVGPYRASVALDTGEASIIYAPRRSLGRSWMAVDEYWEVLATDDGEVIAKRPRDSDSVRHAKNLERADKRALVALRRYCVRNSLLKMLTLTYADAQFEIRAAKRDINALFVRWRHLKDGQPFPYAYVLELHPGGHGLHSHLAVPLRFIDKHWLQETWGHGIVHFRDPKPLRDPDLRERARRLSGYLAKYISKDMIGAHESNRHRYEVAQGFGVKMVRRSFSSLREANQWLVNFRGERFRQVWSSADTPDWEGPFALVYRSPGRCEGR
ncbi:MAG: hypothetical protein EPN30_03975 [Actinomycetota bacterium]|nr:MAG: hypothetical protein EPN30_03975 [Actinomycetota bacterium]